MSQLDAIRDAVAVLEGGGIEYWLFGGWAVDFHAGHVTREHADVDLAIWLDDMPAIEMLLAADGWADLLDPDADGGKAFGRADVRLELTYLCRDGEDIYTPPLDGSRGRWSAEELGDDIRRLENVSARVASLASLTRMKSRARSDPADAAKDHADHGVLRGIR